MQSIKYEHNGKTPINVEDLTEREKYTIQTALLHFMVDHYEHFCQIEMQASGESIDVLLANEFIPTIIEREEFKKIREKVGNLTFCAYIVSSFTVEWKNVEIYKKFRDNEPRSRFR